MRLFGLTLDNTSQGKCGSFKVPSDVKTQLDTDIRSWFLFFPRDYLNNGTTDWE